MAQFILPLLADLRVRTYQLPNGDGFIRETTGPASTRICMAAARTLREHPDAQICVAVGSRRSDGASGRKAMERCLEDEMHVPRSRIARWIPDPPSFTTDGEMHAMVQYIEHVVNQGFNASDDTIIVIARWWHLPRAMAILRKKLRNRHIDIAVIGVAVNSWNLLDMAREVFLAWPKNLILQNV